LTHADINREQLAVWLALNLRWPELGRYLESNPDALGYIKDQTPPKDTVVKDETIRKLLMAPEVREVVDGSLIEITLEEKTIRDCAKLHC
jgi:hypothetical protein